MKIKLDGVMETLLITLYIRAKDAESPKPYLGDNKSREIIQQIDYDFSKFEMAKGSYYGTLARIRVMDREVKKFITKHPKAKIISIGCGLDSRFERVDNGQIHWYNLDFPEVMEKRQLFFAPHERVFDIAGSALDKAWTEQIAKDERPLLIIAEGVLMYFKEEEVKTFLENLVTAFDQFEAQFDLSHKLLVKRGKRHDTLKYMNTEFYFGVTDGSELTKLVPQLKQIGLINFTTEMRKLDIGWFRIFLPFFYYCNNRLGIYVYKRK